MNTFYKKTRDETLNKFYEIMQEEALRDEKVCLWMSFVDDEAFLGVIITEALGLSHAIEKTHDMGINPGGEIRAVEVDPDKINAFDFDRLLSRTDAMKYA